MKNRDERIVDKELKSVFESQDIEEIYSYITGNSLGHSALRKFMTCVYDKETKRTSLNSEKEKLNKSTITCGIKVSGFGGKAIYTIVSFLQIEFFKKLKYQIGNEEIIKKTMLRKKQKLATTFQNYMNILNDSQFSELREYPLLFNTLKLLVRGILEIPLGLPDFADTIYPSKKDQELLAITLDTVIKSYENDLEYMEGWLKHKELGINDYTLFIKLKELLNAYKESIKLLKNQTYGDKKYEGIYKEICEEKLVQLLQGLHENNEFPVLVAELFKRKGYYDIYITPDTRDEGVDIFATKNENDGKDFIEVKVAISLKRYKAGSGISKSHILEIVEAIKKHEVEKGIVITSSTFESGAIELAKTNNIEIINGKELIRELVNLRIGFHFGYVADKDFWTFLAKDKSKYCEFIAKYKKKIS